MNKKIFTGIVAFVTLAWTASYAQRNCGNELLHQELRKSNPEAFLELANSQQRRGEAAVRSIAAASKTAAGKYPIPVVFHILVSSTQYAILGGEDGILRRAKSQIEVLNQDFNRKNRDSGLIPPAFKGLYASADIQFGLATTSSPSSLVPGIEVKVLTTTPSYNVFNGCRAAKENTAVGLPAWDSKKYLNIWVMPITNSVLGLTISPSLMGQQFSDRKLDQTDLGVALDYRVFGAQDNGAPLNFNPANSMGRTLTHEVGHYFELWHIWGDDDNDNDDGYCDGDVVGRDRVGFDDGIGDTPPQARRTYCDFPNHTGGNCPSFPLLDKCSPAAPGVMFMNFMDYVDDASMYMFTAGQAAVVQTEVAPGGASYSLTQQPGLASLNVPKVSATAFNLYPNPAASSVHISLGGSEQLQSIQLMNLTGQLVREIKADGRREYELNTGDVPRGMYFVQCRFAEGTLSRKIVLQ